MLHDVVHAAYLLGHGGWQMRRLGQSAAQHGQRRLQAVGQKAQCVAMPGLAHALLLDQRVQVVCQAGNFGRVTPLDARLLAFFDTPYLASYAPQRRQAPAQQPQLGQQQQHGGGAQPEPQRAGEGTDFAVKSSAVFQHRQHQRRLTRRGLPGDGITDRQKGPAALVQRLVTPLTSLQAAPERQLLAQSRGRLPPIPTQHVVDTGIQARTRQRQTWLCEGLRHHQRAVGIKFSRCQQQVNGALQPAKIGRLNALGICALNRQPCTRQKGQQHQGGSQKQSDTDGDAALHSSVNR